MGTRVFHGLSPFLTLRAVAAVVGAALFVSCGGGGSPVATAPAPGVAISSTALTFGKQPVGTASSPQSVTVTNSGSATLTIASLTVGGAAASNFSLGNGCGNPVAAGTSCTASVTFTPSTTGSVTASLTIADNAPGSPQTVTLSGTGVVSSVSLSASALTFGSQLINTTSAAQTLTVSNTGNATLSISSLALTGSNAGDFAQTNNCGSSIAPGANCTVSVTFTPTAIGNRTAALALSDNAAGSPQSINLTGTAAGAAAAASPSSLTFASQTIGTASSAQTVTVSNQLGSTLALQAITASGDFAVNTGACGTSLAAGATCTVAVTFSPTVVGARSGSLTIPFNASGSPITIPLAGTGNATGLTAITVTPASPSIVLGSSQQFVATGTFGSGSPQNLTASVTWSSSTSSVAKMSNTAGSQGLATSVGPGATTIGATLNSISGSTILTVTSPALVSLAVTPANASAAAGTGVQYTATGSYANGSTQNLTSTVTWTSSATGVATIASGGLASTLAPGQTTIQAQSGSVSASTPLTVTAGFVATGSLNTSRYAHTATLLTSGTALIAGGYNGSALASAEIYNSASGAFAATGSLNTARYYHTATLLPNGLVLFAGGYNGSALAGAELYNPATGAFTATGSLNTARYYHTATLLPNGLVLIAGGYNGGAVASAELYNPGTGKFTTTGALNTARYYHTATLLNTGSVLIAGGYNGSALASAELYNPASGTFTATGGLNFSRYNHTATLLNGGMVLLAGGYSANALATAELFNPAAGTFSATGDLNAARYDHTATLLNNGTVLLAGGSNGSALASAELYSPSAGTFTATGNLNAARYDQTATLLSSGTVLVAGGYNGSGALASGALFHPATLVPANLQSIALTPTAPTVALYGTVRFTATGTYSGGSAQTLASVTWSSANNAVATVTSDASNPGTAYGAAQGSAQVSACTGTVCGSTTLAVGSGTSTGSSTVSLVNSDVAVSGVSSVSVAVPSSYNSGNGIPAGHGIIVWGATTATSNNCGAPSCIMKVTDSEGNSGYVTVQTIDAASDNVDNFLAVGPVITELKGDGSDAISCNFYQNDGVTPVFGAGYCRVMDMSSMASSGFVDSSNQFTSSATTPSAGALTVTSGNTDILFALWDVGPTPSSESPASGFIQILAAPDTAGGSQYAEYHQSTTGATPTITISSSAESFGMAVALRISP